MHGCRVTFSIPGKSDITWVEGYEGVNDLNIKELFVQCTIALASLQDEILCRLGPRKSAEKQRKDSDQLQYCQDGLELCVRRINHDGLSMDDMNQLVNMPNSQAENGAQTDHSRSLEVIKVGLGHMLHKSRDKYVDIYDEFLWLVSVLVSPAVALLVKCSFGSRRITILDLAQKSKLISYARRKKDELFCAKLEEATRLGLFLDDLKSGSGSVMMPRKRKHEEIADTKPLFHAFEPCTASTTTNNESVSTLPSNEESLSSISSRTISQSSPRDANSPQRTQVSSPQNIHLTSSSFEHHTLVGSPSVMERNQVPSIEVAPEPSAIPSDSNYLLLMFHFLPNCEIPYTLFERVRSSQYRWANNGDQIQITALEAGLDQRLVDLVLDETRLTQAIDKLEPLAKRNMSTEGSWTCSIHNQLQRKLSQSLSEWTKDEWAIKFLKWICFIFPRDQFPSDTDQYLCVGKQLLPLLNLALSQVIQKSTPNCIRDDAVEALLVASKIGDVTCRQSAIILASEILGDQPPEHLQVALAHQKSTLLRIAADWDQSEHVIQELCCRTAGLDHSGDAIQYFYRQLQPSTESKRLNALYGRLHVSHLENLLQSEHYGAAAEQVADWKISENPSLMERCVFRNKTVVVAKLFRCQGRFRDVIHTLKDCLKLPLPQMNRIQLICNLADAYCDVGSPDEAYAWLKTEIELQGKRSSRGKQFRRLWVCAIDIDLERGSYDSAQRSIQEMETVYSGLSDMDATDQLLHVRVLLAAARIHFYKKQFPEALGAFTVLINRVQEYRSLKSDGFVHALAHISICLVHLETGNGSESEGSFDYARTIIYREWPDFWIPTAPRWLKYISSKIHSMTGWTLMTKTPLISDIL